MEMPIHVNNDAVQYCNVDSNKDGVEVLYINCDQQYSSDDMNSQSHLNLNNLNALDPGVQKVIITESSLNQNVSSYIGSSGRLIEINCDSNSVSASNHIIQSIPSNLINIQVVEDNNDNDHVKQEESLYEYLDEEYLMENCEDKTLPRDPASTNNIDELHLDNVCSDKSDLNLEDAKTFYHSCNECGAKFVSETFLKYHRYQKEHDLPFICQMCSEMFYELSDFIDHEEKHTENKPYKCFDCGEVFQLANQLLVHRQIHLGSKTKLKNGTMIGLKRSKAVHKCNRCTAAFSTESSLQNHSKRHDFQCTKCGLTCSTAYYYRRHIRTHKATTSYSCRICKSVFASSSELASHMDKHQDFDFQCMDCFKTFKDAKDLKQHRVVHSGNAYIPVLPKPASKSDNDFKMNWKS